MFLKPRLAGGIVKLGENINALQHQMISINNKHASKKNVSFMLPPVSNENVNS
jgi:hypothetical protein